jgi:leucyl aminopeptidase
MRVLAESRFKPHNTIEFHFYAGEEAGLLGSQDIFADYRAKEKSVLAFLNEDMAGYSGSGMFAVFEDYVDTGLTQYVRLIAEEYVGKTPLSGTCGYGCSDHASATANGFRELTMLSPRHDIWLTQTKLLPSFTQTSLRIPAPTSTRRKMYAL